METYFWEWNSGNTCQWIFWYPLGDNIIAPNTIHGKFLSRLTGQISELRNMIDEQLASKEALTANRERNFVVGLPQNDIL